MKHVPQVTGVRNCGQVAVAALTGASLAAVEYTVGHSHGTKASELRNALSQFGWYSDARCYVKPSGTPFLGLAKLRRADTKHSGSWHWIAMDGEWVYDGHQSCPLRLKDYLEAAAIYFGVPVRITSYLRVWRPE